MKIKEKIEFGVWSEKWQQKKDNCDRRLKHIIYDIILNDKSFDARFFRRLDYDDPKILVDIYEYIKEFNPEDYTLQEASNLFNRLNDYSLSYHLIDSANEFAYEKFGKMFAKLVEDYRQVFFQPYNIFYESKNKMRRNIRESDDGLYMKISDFIDQNVDEKDVDDFIEIVKNYHPSNYLANEKLSVPELNDCLKRLKAYKAYNEGYKAFDPFDAFDDPKAFVECFNEYLPSEVYARLRPGATASEFSVRVEDTQAPDDYATFFIYFIYDDEDDDIQAIPSIGDTTDIVYIKRDTTWEELGEELDKAIWGK